MLRNSEMQLERGALEEMAMRFAVMVACEWHARTMVEDRLKWNLASLAQ